VVVVRPYQVNLPRNHDTLYNPTKPLRDLEAVKVYKRRDLLIPVGVEILHKVIVEGCKVGKVFLLLYQSRDIVVGYYHRRQRQGLPNRWVE